MRLHLGSQNPTKIAATKIVFPDDEIVGIAVNIEEFGHPKTLQETINGAIARAKACFAGADLSVGIKSGLFPAPHTKSGHLESTVCALYDGKNIAIGMGPAFEWPPKMTELILSGLDGSQAFKELGLTDHRKIGTEKGAIHVLTKGAIDRTKLNELSIRMAWLQLENQTLYPPA